jgi:hypothetical protein
MGDTRDLYRTDFHAWTGEQAAALRTLLLERSNLPIDLPNLIEEVEALGRGERSRVESLTRLIMQHLLLLEHSPALDQHRHWREEVDEFRVQLEEQLSGSLRRHLEAELDTIYARARRLVARKMDGYGEPTGSLPQLRPYSLEQVETDWLPSAGHG